MSRTVLPIGSEGCVRLPLPGMRKRAGWGLLLREDLAAEQDAEEAEKR